MDVFSIIVTIVGTIISLYLFYHNRKDIRELRRHQMMLQEHGKKLESVRPILSTLFTETIDIRKHAIEMVEEAQYVYGIGTIRVLAKIEKKPNEDLLMYENRTKDIEEEIKKYVQSNSNSILKGKEHFRVLNFLPEDNSEDMKWEIISNIHFFKRHFEFSGTTKINLRLFHNETISNFRGPQHFRCTDKKIILRIGSHINLRANAALVITDKRVVEEYQTFFHSLIALPQTKEINLQNLEIIYSLLINGKIIELRTYLSQISHPLSAN